MHFVSESHSSTPTSRIAGRVSKAGRIPIVLLITTLLLVLSNLLVLNSAFAYQFTGIWWSRTEGGHLWCEESTVTRHTNWSDLIFQSIGQYNGLPYTNPDFLKTTCDNSHKITFNQQVRDDLRNVCGATGVTRKTTGQIVAVEITYSGYQSFWDGVQNGADCYFRSTTLHEYGHGQGLGHSCEFNAVMWDTDRGYSTLQADDKFGMRRIYDATWGGPPYADNPPYPNCN